MQIKHSKFCHFLPEGTLLRSHIPSLSNLSRISQLNIPGFSRLYSSILFSTSGVVPCFRGQRSHSIYSHASHALTSSELWKSTIYKTGFTTSECVICAVGYLRFAAADGPGSYRSRLLVPAKDFGHAAVGDPELPGDDTRPDAVVRHLHNFVTDVVG